jgi:hypothetical protein
LYCQKKPIEDPALPDDGELGSQLLRCTVERQIAIIKMFFTLTFLQSGTRQMQKRQVHRSLAEQEASLEAVVNSSAEDDLCMCACYGESVCNTYSPPDQRSQPRRQWQEWGAALVHRSHGHGIGSTFLWFMEEVAAACNGRAGDGMPAKREQQG